ncbi:hypothetical protein GCM10029963_28520 [Micromonospora andamanensis]
MKYLTYITENPVVLLDIIKYAIAALVLFGVPVPPGVDVAIAGAVLGALTLITRAVVVPLGKHNTAVEDALAMTPPGTPVRRSTWRLSRRTAPLRRLPRVTLGSTLSDGSSAVHCRMVWPVQAARPRG